MRPPRHGKQTVVPLGFVFAFLLDLKNADDPAGHDKARKGRRVMNHHDVERIAVIGFGRWHKAPVVGIGQPGQERLGERECFELRVVGEFRAAATRRFDHDMHVAVFCEGGRLMKFGMAASLEIAQKQSSERCTSSVQSRLRVAKL